MKFTLSWLKDHLETEASLTEICDTLSMIGLEVEGVEDRAEELGNFVVGDVTAARQHPDADRLQLCTVDAGGGNVFEVVCGAPNARAGMKGVFAPEGTYIPGTGITLKKAKIRGVESNGMLCSEKELGLSDDHQGIIELPDDAEIGSPAADALGLSDPTIEIGLTPNRPDCTGVHGIARDLAAVGIGTLKPFNQSAVKGGFESPVQWVRDLPADAEDACPMVVGRTFRNVKNGPSPQWMQDRLKAIGLRPISALVDITNYVSFDLGRPLHVFDVDKLDGDTLTMRLAKAGEKILALDGEEYTLDDGMTVIGDGAGVQGIGGVMGGELSGCTDETTTVFVEVALFDHVRTAETGRKLNIMSDARYRFERGVDPNSALWGAEVAARLILELCGGEASELTIAGDMPDWERQVSLRKSRIRTLGGVEVDDAEVSRILAQLGFTNSDDGETITAAVPPWRPDIDGEADLVEEVIRINGYELIPPVPLRSVEPIPKPALNTAQIRASRVRRTLASRGLIEAVTFSFMPHGKTDPFGGIPDALRVENPISTDLDAMRPSILPNLLDAIHRNDARGVPDGALFEIGADYSDLGDDGQRAVAAGVRSGNAAPRHWSGTARPADALDAKADALAALDAAGAPVGNAQVTTDAPGWYHPGKSGVLRLGPNVLAQFGEIHPNVLAAFDVRGPVVAFEVMLDAVPVPKKKSGPARPLLALSAFQPVERDFAFVVDADVQAEAVLRAARGAEKKLISDVELFDLYEGEHVGEGRKSVAIAVTLQPTEATLTDAEIDAVSGKITAAVEKATGGALRG